MTQSATSNPTQRQIARLYTLAGQAGLSHAEVIEQLRAAYRVDSTKRLTMIQYEEFVAWVRGRIAGGRVTGDGAPPAREGQLWQRAQVARMLDEEWPGLPDDLRDHLADVLDDFRLYRSTGRISAARLRQTVQSIARHSQERVARACEIWLSRYRERNEQYFAGILRRLRAEARAEGRKAGRENETLERERAAAADKVMRRLEADGWKRIGRLPSGEPVYEFRSGTGRLVNCVRGGMDIPLRGDQLGQIIRGADQ